MIHCQASPLGILYTPRGVETMTKLEERLNSIPGAYFAFVHGISKYASKKPERYNAVMVFLMSIRTQLIQMLLNSSLFNRFF